MTGLHGITINLQYRITIELLITDTKIIPIHVGDHDEIYR